MIFFQNITRRALWLGNRRLNIRASCIIKNNMAARLALFSRIFSRTNRHALAIVKSSGTKYFTTYRNPFSHTCKSVSHGCFGRSILNYDNDLLKSRSFSASFIKLSSSSSGNATLGKRLLSGVV